MSALRSTVARWKPSSRARIACVKLDPWSVAYDRWLLHETLSPIRPAFSYPPTPPPRPDGLLVLLADNFLHVSSRLTGEAGGSDSDQLRGGSRELPPS